jgi:hypothetical protein
VAPLLLASTRHNAIALCHGWSQTLRLRRSIVAEAQDDFAIAPFIQNPVKQKTIPNVPRVKIKRDAIPAERPASRVIRGERIRLQVVNLSSVSS